MWSKIVDIFTGKKAKKILEAKAKEEQQKKIVGEIQDLLNKWCKDFTDSPYGDKINTIKVNNETIYHYKFENGITFTLRNSGEVNCEGYYGNYTYKLGHLYRRIYIEYANKTIKEQVNRLPKAKPIPVNHKNTKHPKWELYSKLVETIEKREDDLKACKTKGRRRDLENELNAAKIRMNTIKEKYEF